MPLAARFDVLELMRPTGVLRVMPATQDNLGNALITRGERESGTARLEEAVAAYREALKERTRERAPLGWAATQNNLGNALLELGRRESDTARLEEAVAACREALKETTREHLPLDWGYDAGQSRQCALGARGARGRDGFDDATTSYKRVISIS